MSDADAHRRAIERLKVMADQQLDAFGKAIVSLTTAVELFNETMRRFTDSEVDEVFAQEGLDDDEDPGGSDYERLIGSE